MNGNFVRKSFRETDYSGNLSMGGRITLTRIPRK
jgi:hypothetical protein